MWHGYYFGGGWWMMGLGMLFWGLVIALAVWAVARLSGGARHGGSETHGEAPLDLLKTRYAKGEIDQAEYERVKKHLQER